MSETESVDVLDSSAAPSSGAAISSAMQFDKPSSAVPEEVQEQPSKSLPMRAVSIGVFAVLAAAYGFCAYQGRSDFFIEAQFLHIDFLRSLATGELTERSFFTRYAEHIFPGYNVLIAINYYFLGLSGYYDTIVHALAQILTALLVLKHLVLRKSSSLWTMVAAGACVSFILLSPVNNRMWGMALAAHVGTLLMVVIAMLIVGVVGAEQGRARLRAGAALCLIPVNLLFFTGGYGLGLIAALLAAAVAIFINRPQHRKFAIALAAVTILSTAAYVILLLRQGYNLSGAGSGGGLFSDVLGILQFQVLMAGASIIGQAYLESGQSPTLIYVSGAILWSLGLGIAGWLVWRALSGKLKDGDVFLGLLLAYSIVTILTVSVFRIGNGVEGGMGQWYTSHTKFLPLVVCWQSGACISKALSRSGTQRLLAIAPSVALLAITAIAWVGYGADFRKAPAVGPWKDGFNQQAPALLVTAPEDADRTDAKTTMLWKYAEVKSGLHFLYEHHLWQFRSKGPKVTGLTEDHWLLADQDVTLLCPAGSSTVEFKLWRPSEWPAAKIIAKFNDGSRRLQIKHKLFSAPTSGGVTGVVLSARNVDESLPQTAAKDARKLVAKIDNVVCR